MANPSWLASLHGVREREPLSRHSWYGIGGPAELFLDCPDPVRLQALVPRLIADGVPYTLLGAGTNTLFPDEGLAGLTIKVSVEGFQVEDGTAVVCAGVLMPKLALETARRGLSGLEFGAGVPGTVGGSVVGNAGAFGTEVKDRLVRADAIDGQGRVRVLSSDECAFAYRDSSFKSGDRRGWVVVSAAFQVTPGDQADIRDHIRRVQKHRRDTQPVERRSLGSTFKNPPEDAAGRLIDACGLKGLRQGGAQISPKHANFIVNLGGATADDVLALMHEMQARVRDRFGVELEPEIRVVGQRSDR